MGKENTSRVSSYLYVGSWEDANSAMVFTFIPVLVNLLVNVNNISFLQRKFPVNNTSTPSELHWRLDDMRDFSVQILLSNKICNTPMDTYHAPIKVKAMCWELPCSHHNVQRTLLLFGYSVKKKKQKQKKQPDLWWPYWQHILPAAVGSNSSKRCHWLLSMLDMEGGLEAVLSSWFKTGHDTRASQKDTWF